MADPSAPDLDGQVKRMFGELLYTIVQLEAQKAALQTQVMASPAAAEPKADTPAPEWAHR